MLDTNGNQVLWSVTTDGRNRRITQREAKQRREWGTVDGVDHQYKVMASVVARGGPKYEDNQLVTPEGKYELKPKTYVRGKHVQGEGDEEGMTYLVIERISNDRPYYGYFPLFNKDNKEEKYLQFIEPEVVPDEGTPWYMWIVYLLLLAALVVVAVLYVEMYLGVSTGVAPWYFSNATLAKAPERAPPPPPGQEDELKSWEDGERGPQTMPPSSPTGYFLFTVLFLISPQICLIGILFGDTDRGQECVGRGRGSLISAGSARWRAFSAPPVPVGNTRGAIRARAPTRN